jgi:hypothetical protein
MLPWEIALTTFPKCDWLYVTRMYLISYMCQLIYMNSTKFDIFFFFYIFVY